MSGSYHAPGTLPNALSWAGRAACRGYDLELFFSDAALNVQEAKAICGRCPVRTLCLAEALRAEVTPRYGVSGGLTPAERDALAGEQPKPEPTPGTRRRRAHLTPCGTLAAYRRHLRDKEQPCEPCRRANAEEQRAKAEKKGRVLAPCGTNSAYNRHVRNGEPIDQACRDAHAYADRRLRTTGSSKAQP